LRIQKSFEQAGGILYIVGTPIGNLQDVSARAEVTLREVDLIAAEDTRHTRKLCTHLGLHVPFISYHEHNRQIRGVELIERLKKGESIALVSDAGMPAISDPGEDLVQTAIQAGIAVVPIPGPNAALSALVASGLPTQPSLFLGFLPRRSKARKVELQRWRHLPATLVCYEAPHRLVAMLEDVQAVFGERKVAVCRELTKRHEEWLRGANSDCIKHIRERGVRGEYTIVIAGAEEEVAGKAEEQGNEWSTRPLGEHVQHYMQQGMRKKEAMQHTAKDRGLSRREVYNQYHQEISMLES
jgi:16S rRNA (cytidine1402-2'-O)-methyltransferase